ncbi:TRSP domain-containing protein [Candidatus Thiothrix anitrata]|nr:TRSP domain-containing protein [Candidatus Thiothrix anitrata]
MPQVDVLGTGEWHANPANDRDGWGAGTWGFFLQQHQRRPRRTHPSLGTGEFVWPPFLLAEYLEQQGATVHFSATTRSPIALGHSIQHRYCFHDNYGQGIPTSSTTSCLNITTASYCAANRPRICWIKPYSTP